MKKFTACLLSVFLLLILTQNVFAQERSYRGYNLGFEALSPIDEGISVFKVGFFSTRQWSYDLSSVRNFSIALYRTVDDEEGISYVPVYNADDYLRARILQAGVLDFSLQAGMTYNSVGGLTVGTAFLSVGTYSTLQVTPNFSVYSDTKIPFLWGISVFGRGKFKFMDDFLFSQKIGFKYEMSYRFALGMDLEMSNMNMIGVASEGRIFTFGTNIGLTHYY